MATRTSNTFSGEVGIDDRKGKEENQNERDSEKRCCERREGVDCENVSHMVTINVLYVVAVHI